MKKITATTRIFALITAIAVIFTITPLAPLTVSAETTAERAEQT